MTNKELEKQLSSAVRSIVPKNTFKKISEMIISENSEERRIVNMTIKRNNVFKKFVIPTIAACMGLVVGAFGFSYYSNNIAVDSVIDIDVNPSIEISSNKQDRVIKAVAINADGEEILDGMDLSKTDLKIAVNAIVGSMVQKGYVIDEKSGILVTVQNKDSVKAERIRNMVITDIDQSLTQHKINAPVINQAVTDSDEAKQFANQHGISIGKAVFVLNLEKKDATLNAEILAGMDIMEIAEIVVNNKINISDIVDYDADDSIWENISDTIEDVNENVYENNNQIVEQSTNNNVNNSTNNNVQKSVNKNKNANKSVNKNNTNVNSTDKVKNNTINNNSSSIISVAKAKKIALNHAGVKAKNAKFTKVKLERDDGRTKYDVEFYSNSIEYNYDISATSGKILDFEREYERSPTNKNKGTVKNNNKSTGFANKTSNKVTNNKSSSSIISADKAKKIALNHAGVNANNVTFIKAELDRDDGIIKYEVEFLSNNIDFDYEINASNGKIINFEKEHEDDD